jgi:FixJ family two-component response regulator
VAIDFLPKPFRDDQLLPAVAQALARSAEECQQRGEVVESRARLAKLTPREFEVFRLVIAGLLNKEIGAELGVSLRTIKTHRARVMQKIRVVSVAELVRLAQKAGVAPARHGPKGP